jgi:hypothetical protein
MFRHAPVLRAGGMGQAGLKMNSPRVSGESAASEKTVAPPRTVAILPAMLSTVRINVEGIGMAASSVKFKRTARDTAYFIADIVPMTRQAHSTYGAFHLYLKQAETGKINPADFKNVDTADLRRMLDTFSQQRGPITGFDFRWFYWLYAVMILQCLWCVWQLFALRSARREVQTGLNLRKENFGKDYIEDLRGK